VWRSSVSLLEPYSRARVEAGLLWYGTRSSEELAVAVLTGIPKQTNAKRNFDISADDLAALNRAMAEDLVVVAQVHTHPGEGTEHSPWDDAKIVSRKIFSLVFPRYGSGLSLPESSVHEFVDGEWRALDAVDAARRVTLAPDSIDTRP